MDSLDLLTTRRSTKNLSEPAPDELQLDTILQAATQVPDHGDLTPYRFVVINQERMSAFHQLLKDSVSQLNLGEEAMKKADKVGTMAPMILAVIASPKAGKPEWEQHMSAGCAAYAAQLAAKAQGFDNVWISGLWVNVPLVRAAFACEEQEKIVALIMLGTASAHLDEAKNTEIEPFVRYF